MGENGSIRDRAACADARRGRTAMRRRDPALYGASLLLLAAATSPVWAQAAGPARGQQLAAASTSTVSELVVTAEKREENIQNVGMSIQAASGDRLLQLGIQNTTDLTKIGPGFEAPPNYSGPIVYTIRGVGFQDPSLAGSPTVSVYQDQMPLPFSILTAGAS